jgi:hypothetical protein
MSTPSTKAVEVTTQCPACRDGATTQQAIYKYVLAYLCAECREWWIDMDAYMHRGVKSKGPSACPHHPNACVLGRDECRGPVDERAIRLGGSRS